MNDVSKVDALSVRETESEIIKLERHLAEARDRLKELNTSANGLPESRPHQRSLISGKRSKKRERKKRDTKPKIPLFHENPILTPHEQTIRPTTSSSSSPTRRCPWAPSPSAAG